MKKKEGVSDIKEEKKVQDSNIISKKEKTDLFDVTRESSIDETGTLTVTTTINPKEIDHGAEVIVLLDTSRKMVQADSGEAFKKAKEKIKELVTTLVGEGATHGQRNSVRIITFDKHASELHNLTADNIDKTLNNIDTDTKYRNQYGVALQEAIHKARTTFDSEREKAEKNKTIKYNKRQHIVLFSQGEATFSYDLTDKTKATKQDINEDVTYSYPMWPFYFDTTVSKGNIVTDAKKAIPLANIGNKTLGLFGAFLGADNPLDYRTLKEFKYDGKDASQFDYSNKIGEGYNYRSFSDIDTNRPDGALEFIKEKVKNAVSKDTKALETLQYYFPFVKTATDATIDAVLDRLFHPRSYIFHNHNLAAKAEAKLAQNADIKVYSVDVTTDTNFEKFDNYLKSMSDNENMLEISKNNTELATKFRDTLKNITITDTLKDILDISTLVKPDSLKYEDKKESSWFGTIQKSILTWSLDKDAIKEAFEQGKPLTVTYKIKVKTPHNSKRPETAISPELKYTINDKTEKAFISFKILNSNKWNQKLTKSLKLTLRALSNLIANLHLFQVATLVLLMIKWKSLTTLLHLKNLKVVWNLRMKNLKQMAKQLLRTIQLTLKVMRNLSWILLRMITKVMVITLVKKLCLKNLKLKNLRLKKNLSWALLRKMTKVMTITLVKRLCLKNYLKLKNLKLKSLRLKTNLSWILLRKMTKVKTATLVKILCLKNNLRLINNLKLKASLRQKQLLQNNHQLHVQISQVLTKSFHQQVIKS
ncbi:serum opacification factor [Streptococcus hillyeri]|uniref:serum opacification factor n=1 Tax=Streptococcus hillyeri TaxID=2282420 RepID=UPI0034E1C9C4